MLFGTSTNNPFVLITCIVFHSVRILAFYGCFYFIFFVHHSVQCNNVSVPYLLQLTDSVICNRQHGGCKKNEETKIMYNDFSSTNGVQKKHTQQQHINKKNTTADYRSTNNNVSACII